MRASLLKPTCGPPGRGVVAPSAAAQVAHSTCAAPTRSRVKLVSAMSEMHYEPVLPRSREELDTAFRSGDPGGIHDALISAAYWDDDWRWAQDQCLSFADHDSAVVRAGTAYALGLIAVFHAKLELDRVVPVLRRLAEDPVVRPHADR